MRNSINTMNSINTINSFHKVKFNNTMNSINPMRNLNSSYSSFVFVLGIGVWGWRALAFQEGLRWDWDLTYGKKLLMGIFILYNYLCIICINMYVYICTIYIYIIYICIIICIYVHTAGKKGSLLLILIEHQPLFLGLDG